MTSNPLVDELAALREANAALARKLAQQEHALAADAGQRAARQHAAITRMVFDEAMNSGDAPAALRRLTEAVATALEVARAGVWLMSEDGTEMRCIEQFEAGPGRHSAGAVLRAADYPRYWAALQSSAWINADDAVTDPRTSEFAEGYLIPLGIASMLDAILQVEGMAKGVLCLEHTGTARHWQADEQSFANTAAALVAQVLVTSERRQAEAAVRASETRYRTLIERMGEGLVQVDNDDFIRFVNPQICRMLGYAEAELLGQHAATLLNCEADRAAMAERNRQRAAGISEGYEIRLRKKSGEFLLAWNSATPLTTADGRTVGSMAIVTDITERRQAERRLRESEHRLDRAVRNINDVLIVDDAAGRVVFANQKFFQLFGLPDQVLDGIRIEDYVAPEWRARQRELHDRRVRGEAVPDHFECEGLRRDGTRVWLEVSVVPVTEQGRIVGTQSVFRDITERKRAEQRIVAFSDLGRRLSAAGTARAASEIIVEVADCLVGWDSCVVNLYSADSDTIQSVLRKDLVNGQRREVEVPSSDRSVTPRARRVLAHGGELELREASVGMPSDAVPFGDVSRPSRSLLSVPIRDGARAIGLLSIQSYQPQAYTAQDLELLQALAEHCGGALNRLHAEEEARRLAAFPQMNPNPVLELTAAGEIIYCNAAANYLASELGFARPSEMLPPETAAIVRACLGSGLKQQRLELPYGKRVISWSFYPIPLRGVVHCYAGDVTQRRSLEEQLRESQKMEAIGQLAGGIAHDFNNLLGAILGNVELARTMPPADPDLPASLDAIFTASQRATDLVKQILAFSRRQEQQRQPLQLALVVREAVKLLRATVPAAVEFRPHLATMPVVLADPSTIHQVAMNLCTNAWHALHGQPGVIRVELAEQTVDADFARQHPDLRPGRYVRLTVADNGCGMDAATRARIFEPFFTTKPVGTGTGLGLAVVHGIMKSHDGGIVVTSEPGQGTTFELYFPVFEAEVSESIAEPAPVPRGAGEHILFVDDEEVLVKLGKTVLTRLGYRVTVATSPTEALAVFRAQPGQFDLVLTDYNMPGMNGTVLGAQVLATRPEQRIILTTGFSADVTEAVARELGFSELLPKPYTMRSLAAAVQRALPRNL